MASHARSEYGHHPLRSRKSVSRSPRSGFAGCRAASMTVGSGAVAAGSAASSAAHDSDAAQQTGCRRCAARSSLGGPSRAAEAS
eukprot:3149767-Prymnesium_polylepis.1